MGVRPVGRVPWTPDATRREWVRVVRDVVESTGTPVTVRQGFYRLVAAGLVDKSANGAKAVSDALTRARRSGLLPFAYIADDSAPVHRALAYPDKAGFRDTVADLASRYRRDRLEGQPVRPVVVSEGRGLVPLLAQVADDYGVPVVGLGGFPSVSAMHDLGQQAATGTPLVLLVVADHDPSGDGIAARVADDVAAFAGRPVEARRVALTREQVERYGVALAPAKATDSRSRTWPHTGTAEVEALDPALLQRLVRDEVEDLLDLAVLDEVLALEQRERAALVAEYGGAT